MKKKKLSKFINKKNNGFLFFALSTLTACNNDSKKILGLAGNAASEGLEKLFEQSPSINSNYTISTNSPDESKGNGTSSLPITVAGSVNASPTISGYPLLDFTFNSDGNVDFTNISDVKNVSISNSTAAASLTNLSNDLEKIFVKGIQSGDWNIAYKPDSAGILIIDWTNNTGESVDLTSLTINEAKHFLLNSLGNEPLTIPAFNLDPDDIERIQIENNNDGDITIAADTDITGSQSIKTISLKTINDGNITLGSPGISGLPDLQNISSITLIASKNGDITVGNLGSKTSINKISNISLTTEGGSINLGTVDAKQVINFTISGNEFSSISIGDISIEEKIENLILSGDANITFGKFSGDGTVKLDASNMTKNGLNLDFSALKGVVDLVTTNKADTILLGEKSGKVISGGGDDIITLPANTVGNADIRSGDGVDTITLSNANGIDIINAGGTNINLIDKTAKTHSAITADKIINFDTNSDKIGIGSITATSSNFLAETGATTFGDALTKSNVAMASGKKYYFSYNVATATEGFGLLFYDSDSDGSSDVVLTLTGITTNALSHDHLIIV